MVVVHYGSNKHCSIFFYVLVGHEKITMERKFKLSHVVFLR